MKAFNRTLFTVFILLPCLILGYQNCAELSSQNSLDQESGSSPSLKQANTEPPVFLNDLSLLGYTQPSDCSADPIPTIKVYSSEKNICTEASNSCEAFYLINDGFREDQSQACEDVDHPEDEDFQAALKTSSAADAGYKSKAGQICSMQFAEMVSFKTRECARATNGCEISFFKAQGFVEDRFELCN